MKQAFVSGATAGIGEAMARALVAAGWRVTGTGRRADRLDALAAELGEAFVPLVLDMADRDALAALPLPDSLDLLVNNAGFAPPMSDFDGGALGPQLAAIETNVIGLVALTHRLLPAVRAARGLIVNLASVAATYPYRGGAIYGPTKSFVRQFSLNLRCDLAGSGVRVTSIEPGMVETEFTLVRNGGDRAASDALYADMEPLTAHDIADQLMWLTTLPGHVNINSLEIMPTRQSFAGFAVQRMEN